MTEVRKSMKLPPVSMEAEIQVLGSLFLNMNAAYTAETIVQPPMFSDSRNELIFKTQIMLANKGVRPDIIATSEELKRRGELERAGGILHLTDISSKVPTAANVSNYCYIVKEKYLGREIIRITSQYGDRAYSSADILETLEKLSNDIDGLHLKRGSLDYHLVEECFNSLVERLENPDLDKGIPLPWADLHKFGNMQPGQMIVVAGATSMGKSALAQNLLFHLSLKKNIPGVIITLEMTEAELTERFVSMATNIPVNLIEDKKLSDSQMETIKDAQEWFTKKKLVIDSSAVFMSGEILPKLRYYKKKYGIKIAVIDYMQLITGSGNFASRAAEVGHISRKIKEAAMALQIPIIAIAQLNRGVDAKANKYPDLSDLKESGSIEQDANKVFFIYRPEKYGKPKFANGSTTENRAMIISAKNRNGALGATVLYADMSRMSFTCLDNRDYPEYSGDFAPEDIEKIYF